MELEIRPEPSPDEREAIAAALRKLEEEAQARRSPWWEAGLEANLDGPESADG